MNLICSRIINSHTLVNISFTLYHTTKHFSLFFLSRITSRKKNLQVSLLREVMVYPQCVIQGTGHYALACSLHLIYCTDTMQDGYTITHWGLQIHIGGSKESRGYPSAQGSHSSIRSKRQLLAALLHLSPLTSHKSVMVLLTKQVQTPVPSCV